MGYRCLRRFRPPRLLARGSPRFSLRERRHRERGLSKYLNLRGSEASRVLTRVSIPEGVLAMLPALLSLMTPAAAVDLADSAA